MRVVGLDVGTKRIGVAVSDPMGWTAQGYGVLQRRGPKTLEALCRIVQEVGAEEVVVGLPRRTDGTLGDEAREVMKFAEHLKEVLKLPVVFWDERFSTAEAERILLMADQSRRKRRKVIDKLAAVIILQGYLDSRREKG